MALVERLLPLTTKAALLSWAEKIQPHVPHCLTMYNNLLQHGRGHASYATFYVLKDRPDAHAVLWEWTYSPSSQQMGVFCLKEEVEELTEALASAPFVDCHRSLFIHHIPPYLLNHLKRRMEEKGVTVTQTSCDAFTYYLHLDTEPLRLGPGFRVCRLGTAGVRRVLEINENNGNMSLAMLCGLAQSVPYLGVYLDEGKIQSTALDVSNLSMAKEEEVPVALCISAHIGAVARLWTEPEYRRRGLGGLITTAVARAQASHLGFVPHAFVVDDNTASLNMFKKLPGWRQSHQAFWLSTSDET